MLLCWDLGLFGGGGRLVIGFALNLYCWSVHKQRLRERMSVLPAAKHIMSHIIHCALGLKKTLLWPMSGVLATIHSARQGDRWDCAGRTSVCAFLGGPGSRTCLSRGDWNKREVDVSPQVRHSGEWNMCGKNELDHSRSVYHSAEKTCNLSWKIAFQLGNWLGIVKSINLNES